MSWDAYLECDCCGHSVITEQNYTHNTNGMINEALGAGEHWLDRLHGASREDGVALLDAIIEGLEADPERFRAMNPPNGWGSYDSLLRILQVMRDQAANIETASTWSVSR